MRGFNLPANYQEDPESLLRRVRPRVVPPQKQLKYLNQESIGISTMAQKTIREFSAPSNTNVKEGPEVTIDGNFELKPALINMVQASPFCGKPNEDANAHLQHFLEICSTFTIRGISADAIRL
jgi:hypothetical protein